MERTWTITELAGEAAAILAAGPAAPADQVNGRVRDMPNERLIRWYTTIGLVDPPLARRGRTALYGQRHLLQLVAVKRRQAAGLTIAEIQTELAGAPDDTLRAIARLPGAVTETRTGPGPRRDRFWAAAPAPGPDGTPPAVPTGAPAATSPAAPAAANPGASAAVPAVPGPAAPARAVASARARPAEGDAAVPPAAVPPAVVHGVRLAPGVTLLLDGGAVPGPDDLAALAVAARPVLDELHRRGLAGPSVPADQPAHDTSPGSSS
ncbi:MerR family transcriptional regulator [Actinomadura scrupuli]|uniref:helix-turn-helix domain-containing protein n=1 Tax=Actinomadura scrupuli TaxID=559629 RepID=UPI003D99F265